MAQTGRKRAEKYIAAIQAGDVVVSQFVRKAVGRHIADLESGHKRNLKFDPVQGERVIRFVENFCRHSQGEWAGNPVVLEPWQCAMLYLLYGWRWASTGYRRFRFAYVELAKGNGKSFLASALALYELIGQGEPGAEVYSVATKKDQARIVFSEAERMVKQSPALKYRIRSFRDNLHIPGTASKFQPLSSDEDSLDGPRPQALIADELHAWGGSARKLWDVLANALGKRRSPLFLVITTSGSGTASLCWEQHVYSDKVLSGSHEDDTWFAWVCCLDSEQEWEDESCWIKANPNLGVSVQLDELRAVVNKAKGDPASLNGVLRLRLGVWTSALTAWIPADKWAECSTKYTEDDLSGQPCFGGLDLSTTTDLSAYVLLFPPTGQRKEWAVLPYLFIPDDAIEKRSKRDRVPYDLWKRQGLVTATPGNVIDYDAIRQRIKWSSQQFDLREVAYDPWNATETALWIEQQGITAVPIRQGFQSITGPSKKLMELILTRKLAHGGHAALRWMASNVMVLTDPAGNIKPDKAKSTEKIDGIVALIVALARAMVANLKPATPSFGFLVIDRALGT